MLLLTNFFNNVHFLYKSVTKGLFLSVIGYICYCEGVISTAHYWIVEVAHHLVLFKVLKSKAGLKTRLLLEFHSGEAHSPSTDYLCLYTYYSIYSPTQEKLSVTLLCSVALSKDVANVLSLASRARLLQQSWVIVPLVKTLIIIIDNAPHNGHLAGCLAATEGLNEKTNTNILYFEELC